MAVFEKKAISLHQKMAGDAVRVGKRIPHIYTFVELDATQAREQIRAYRRETGKQVSFSAYLMHCCAKAIEQDKEIQTMAVTRNKLITPSQVDFFVPLEARVEDGHQLTSRLIRNVPDKTPSELDDLLRTAVTEPAPVSKTTKAFLRLPWFVRSLFYRWWQTTPNLRQRYFGSVYYSSIINYSADRRTWGLPIPMHALGIFVGTTSKRVVETSNGNKTRDMVQLTISVDHRANNGGDMARFVHRLKYLLEHQNLPTVS
ncbi:MAG: 2-oxo acid dehydrogenase subunit E2 [Bacteroidia bacterium]|nr:2-oxo acid dehydrogenase subunit E2 [Bacteroidia bacterium]